VPGSKHVVEAINRLRREENFSLVVLSCDWHPLGHCSFITSHPESPLFSEVKLRDGSAQIVWPVHCVQYSVGAAFHPDLVREISDFVVPKGKHKDYESYSAFGHPSDESDLNTILSSHNITDTVFVGLATDYCVGISALDSSKRGYTTSVRLDACRGIDPNKTEEMVAKLSRCGVKIVSSVNINSGHTTD